MIINFNRLTDINLRNKISEIFIHALTLQQIKGDISVNVSFVGKNNIKTLNNTHRNVNKVTDVLSFPLLEKHEISLIKTNEFIDLGDIVICKSKAFAQAAEYGHSYEREVCFLALHGLLHLLGYDHMTTGEEKEMFDLQNKILNFNKVGR